MHAGVGAVVGSGLMMSAGNKALEEVHEVAVYALLAVAAVHVLGVLIHTVVRRENITLGMITGRKEAEAQAAIRSAAPVSAMIFLAVVAMLGGALLRSYDPNSRRIVLPLIGTSIALAEADEGDHHQNAAHRTHHKDEARRHELRSAHNSMESSRRRFARPGSGASRSIVRRELLTPSRSFFQ
jgi:cytochrome b561-like protein